MNQQPKFTQSLLIFLAIAAILFTAVFLLHAEPHIPLLATTVIVACMLKLIGFRWSDLEEGILKGIQSAISPILLLSLIGILIGVWMMSGTVPTILLYGIDLISPQYFAVSALLITIVVSMFTGSSFTTVSTVGVALMGVGLTMGVNPPMAAGAIICGACFGDKMSPLSDTTNFAPAVSGVSLYTHISNMMYTTIPAMAATVIFFLGGEMSYRVDMAEMAAIKRSLEESFTIHWVTLLSPLAVLYCSVKRKPVIPTLVAGIVTGLLLAALVQHETSVSGWFQVMQTGYKGDFSNETVASILNRGGLQSMMWSVSLILIALSLGGLLQHCGVIEALFQRLVKPLKRKGDVVVAAGSSSIAVNAFTGEQYLSILLPGQMFKEEFARRQIPPKTLSRTLEDCGTLVNPLVPWGVSGAFFASTLHVPVAEYLPYVPYLWLSPLLTFFYAYLPKRKRQNASSGENNPSLPA